MRPWPSSMDQVAWEGHWRSGMSPSVFSGAGQHAAHLASSARSAATATSSCLPETRCRSPFCNDVEWDVSAGRLRLAFQSSQE